MTRESNGALVVVVLLVTFSAFVAGAAGGGGAGPAEAPADGVRTQQASADVDPALANATGTVTVVLRLDRPSLPRESNRRQAMGMLKRHAEETQRPVREELAEIETATIVGDAWLANALLVRVDASETSVDRLARIDGVRRIHPNFEVTIPQPQPRQTSDAPEDGADAAVADYDTTYGLAQIDAPEVWRRYGARGDGVKVAVLDTGVDVDHPDIALYTEDESDPTYPGGWAEFDSSGTQVPGSEPHDTESHGTHVSGTVAGGNASGEYIGVAPDAELMHGLVIPNGSGTFMQIVAGMEWAVAEDADVMSMSLGNYGYWTEMIAPVQHAEAADTIVVGAIGNAGEGISGSPGNVYETVGVGASDVNRDIASFSSGEVIDTDQAWGANASPAWPEEYAVPDVAAPGVAVMSSVPDGDYAFFDGTSMATPHVAGTLALMQSATAGDARPATLKDALYATAKRPANASPTRYGAGIVDALEATQLAKNESGVHGTVTDSGGTPLANVTVSSSFGNSDVTNETGAYSMLALPGTWNVTVDEFGYEAETKAVTVTEGAYTTRDFVLNETVEADVLEDQPEEIEAGDTIRTRFAVANLESVTVALEGGYAPENATLSVDGQPAAFGEPITFADPVTSDNFTVTVATEPGTAGEIELEMLFEGAGAQKSVTTGPTAVFEDLTRVGVVRTIDAPWENLTTTLEACLPAGYSASYVDFDEPFDADAYDAFVVQEVGYNASANRVNAFLEAADESGAGIVFLDQWGSAPGSSNGIEALSNATGDPSGVNQTFEYPGAPVQYEIRSNHSIFEGIGSEGDRVTVYTDTDFTDRAWFLGYSGEDLADVAVASSPSDGPSVGVDEAKNHVLLTLGRSVYIDEADFTGDANRLLANAVTHVVADGPSPPPEPRGASITLESATASVNSSVTVNVSANASNVAGYQANVTFDPDVVQVERVEGAAFADPVVRVDNETGYVRFTQAAAKGVDDPVLARLTLSIVADEPTETALRFVRADTRLNNESAHVPIRTFVDGQIQVQPSCTPRGDVNHDGAVTSLDATLVLRHVTGLPTGEQFDETCADVNDDGEITSLDATLILRLVVGLEDETSVEAASPAESTRLLVGSTAPAGSTPRPLVSPA